MLNQTLTDNPRVRVEDFNPFAGPEIALIAPATEPQMEIWTSCLIGGNDASCAYNDFATIVLSGEAFDKEAMLKAAQALSDRHEALRSVFSADGAHIIIYKHLDVLVDYHDISDQDDEQNRDFVKNYCRQLAITALDLKNGPLFKIALIKLNDTEHQVILLTHHIICDGWSMGLIMQDLGKLYNAFAQGVEPNLPSAPHFSVFAVEEANAKNSAEHLATEQYWVEQFKGSDHLLDIPTDNPRPTPRTFKSTRADYGLDTQLVADLRNLARKTGTSLVTAILASFEVFLHQLTGQDEVIVGLPAAGQAATGNFGLVGHCVNLLPLRSFPHGAQTFANYLKDRKSTILDAYDNQQYTFGSLLKKLAIPRDPSRLPLVPIMFNIDIGMDEGIGFHNLKHRYINNPREYETFEIFLNVTDNKGTLTFEWSYNTQLFQAATITRFMQEFEHLLRYVVKTPDVLIGKLPLMNAEQVREQLNRWNNTRVNYPRDKPLNKIISETAMQYPDKVALKFGKEEYTYAKLNDKSNQFAAVLIENGVKVADKVAISVDRDADLVIALLGIMKAGATYIPLDPIFPINRINYMLEDSAAVVLVTTKKYSGKYISNAKELLLDDIMPKLGNYADSDPAVVVQGEDLLYILYTSGSTGQPKGVQIKHHNAVNFLYSMQKQPGLTAADKLLAVTTISFDIAGLELWLPLITGAQIVLADAIMAKDGQELLQTIRNEQITVMQATPYTWRIMLEAGWGAEQVKVICGGEALPMDLAQRILERASSLWNVYGPTETTIWSTLKEIKASDGFISIGRPIDNTYIYILDKFQNPLGPGAAGEIYIAGEGVAKGYLNQPALTEEKFVHDPFDTITPNPVMYRTGDLGTFTADGDLMYISRIDAQVKIRGYRIETGEIEFNLGKEEAIKQAVVVARNDKNGVAKLVAYVLLNDNFKGIENPTDLIQKWRTDLRNSVPDYMLPDNFAIIDEMPMTPNGKVDKKVLAASDIDAAETVKYVAPTTDTERLLSTIWKELLGIEQVGINDNFFELGGHSLIAVKVMARIEQETGERLPLAILFENSTIEKLAAVMDSDVSAVSWDSLVPIKPTGSKVPIYIVHGAGLNVLLFNTLANNVDDEQPVYGLQAKGLNGVDEPLNRMEDMAAHYVSSILAQNPDGPYALAGFSFGGLIAFEMARQMKALNKDVRMLAMFDTYAYRTPHYDPWATKQVKRGLYLGRKVWHSVTFKDGFLKTIRKRSEAIKRSLVRLFWKLRHGEKQDQVGFFGYSNRIDEANNLAQKYYLIAPSDLEIELFRAETRSYYLDDYEYMGWRPYALKGINIHSVPGEHTTMFKEPNDKIFARVLQDCLDKINY
ncbi:amino acid adenylation domain-containing protein [Mucilaginibacter achroorhodeus]|uniref:Amino acid adenylation domain-containing protein n=1 Tax=Mucilaginibacter achroorhodeus TaxID=2599294 RepID=A0A563U746_9SPHI|nr:non-ribosomal peptide synthetase [Mucilaginibacter achroorhodeus]TWR27177.1 amino acid adenylation domain-containing protein [Mucilaginibacter achroorhodeus]